MNSSEKTFYVDSPPDKVFEAAQDALKSMAANIRSTDPNSGIIVAAVGVSLLSFGDELRCKLRAQPPGTSIHIVSTTPGQSFAWSKNQRNINTFEQNLYRALGLTYLDADLPPVAASTADDVRDQIEMTTNLSRQEQNDLLIRLKTMLREEGNRDELLRRLRIRDDLDPSIMQEIDNLLGSVLPAKTPANPTPVQPPSPAAPTGGPRIFISYRRADTIDICGRMYDRLTAELGRKSIFKDVDSIPIGVDFVEHLENAVKQCTVLLAVIGPQWASIVGENGSRRLHDPNDFVRIEVESALRQKIRVVPVLVGGAKMPAVDDLPPGLQPLVRRNAIMIRPDPDFHTDMSRLIRGLVE